MSGTARWSMSAKVRASLLAALLASSAAIGVRVLSKTLDRTLGALTLIALGCAMALMAESMIVRLDVSSPNRARLRWLSLAVVLLTISFLGRRWSLSTALMTGVEGAAVLVVMSLAFARALSRVDVETKRHLSATFGSLLLCYVVAECGLRIWMPSLMNYGEASRGVYLNPYSSAQSWLWTHQPFRDIVQHTVEFTHRRHTNGLGLTGPDLRIEKESNEYRIIALGDSFTEGVGATEDAAWPMVLERKLSILPDNRITMMNAGIMGSDPFFQWILLKEKLLPFEPDMIVVAVNSSDVSEITVRGGAERFRSDGTTVFRAAPRWEWMYERSYTVRLLVHGLLGYDRDFIKRAESPTVRAHALAQLEIALKRLRDLCRDNRMTLVVVFLPMEFEFVGTQSGESIWDLAHRLEREPGMYVLDLLRFYERHRLITKETASEFYWKLDRHHNAEGYRIMGESVARFIIEKELVPTLDARRDADGPRQ